MARPPYDKSLRPLARTLRKRMPKSERRLWSRLRNDQVQGYRFYRQFIILRYIVDFYCRPLRLVVEVDGVSHDDPRVAEHDLDRQEDLEGLGIEVIRFSSDRVLNDLDNVLRAIHGRVSDLSGSRAQSPGT